jgi:serine beta-lactamase-like protein LACTB
VSRPWNRLETWLGLGVLGVGLLLMAMAGLWMFMSATATPLHPNQQDVPSVTGMTPLPQWTGGVEQGRQIVRAALVEHNLPGVSVAVGVGGDLVWAEGFGWAALEKQVPVSPTRRFRIGTASTVLTSAAVGRLVERGRLNLDAEIQTYVPEFPKKAWPVTVRQSMGHLAGVGTDGGDEGPLFSRSCVRPVEGVPAFADDPLRFAPGTQYRHSSYGWILISAAVEAAGGEPFFSFMRDQVFDPLGMRDTRADSATRPVEERATFYFPRFAADPRYGPDPMREIDLSCYAGASAFVSTPSDLVRFGLAIDRGALLHPDTVELLQTSQRLPSGQETGYGLGWDLERVTLNGHDARVVGHDGDVLGGMVASLLMFRDQWMVVAVTSNTSYADTFALASKIAEAFGEQAGSRKRP